jgi:hypothetical protein
MSANAPGKRKRTAQRKSKLGLADRHGRLPSRRSPRDARSRHRHVGPMNPAAFAEAHAGPRQTDGRTHLVTRPQRDMGTVAANRRDADRLPQLMRTPGRLIDGSRSP